MRVHKSEWLRGKIMKKSSLRADVRIKGFMRNKMTEFPELKQKYGPAVWDVQRGYFFENLVTKFTKRV